MKQSTPEIAKALVLTGFSALSILVIAPAPAQAVGILLQSEAGYTGLGLDLSAYTGNGYNFTTGPASIPGGITFTATTPSVLGQGSYGLSGNGNLGGNAVYAGLNTGSVQRMTFSFASAISSFGAFVNYAPGSGTDPTISTFDSSNTLLSTFNLATLAPISTPGGFNQFVFRGIDEGSAIISSFQLSGSYIVAAGSADGSAASTSTAVPEPFTIIGTLIGGTAAFRMRKKLKALAE